MLFVGRFLEPTAAITILVLLLSLVILTYVLAIGLWLRRTLGLQEVIGVS